MRRWWLRVTAGAVVLVAVGAWSLALQVGASSGEAFALAVPPPTIPASLVPAASEVTTATAVDTTVAVVGAEGAGAAAAGTVCAATVACALIAVGVVGAAYGTYSLLHWAFGSHHKTVTSHPANSGSCTMPDGTTVVDYESSADSSGNSYIYWRDPPCSYYQYGWNTSGGVRVNANATAEYNGCTNYQVWFGDGSTQSGYNYCQSYSTISAPNNDSIGPLGCSPACSYASEVVEWVITLNGTPIMSMRLDGQPQRVPNMPLPQHTVKTDIACMDGSGHVSSHVVTSSPGFDDSMSSVPDTSAQPCPNGTIPGQATVTETTPGQADTPLYTVPAPHLDPSNPCSAVGAKCAPTLQRTDGRLWVDDPNDYPSPSLDGSYRCEWLGPNDSPDGGPLSMSDCVAAQPAPNPSPSASPSPAPNQLDPYVPQAPPTSDGRSCFPHGIGLFNPIEWVFKPTVCALRWAFVPDSASVQADVSTLSNTWDQTPPGVVVTSAHKLIDPFTNAAPTGSDCAGPLVSFSIPSPFSSHPDNYSVAIHPFSMCNQIGAWVHDYFYPLMTLVLYLATFWQVARTLTSTIGLDTPFDEDGGGMASPL